MSDKPRCPKCGEPIHTVTQDFDVAILGPCGHEVPPDHPALDELGD